MIAELLVALTLALPAAAAGLISLLGKTPNLRQRKPDRLLLTGGAHNDRNVYRRIP